MALPTQSTKDAARLIRAGAAAAGYKAIISYFSSKDHGGYHAGRKEIFGPQGKGTRDYSIRRPRDASALTDFGAAMDVSMRGAGRKKNRQNQKAFTAYLVAEIKAGRAVNIAEVIGLGDDGRAYQWGWYNNWTPQVRAEGDSHEWHTHVSFWRDTESADRASEFKAFYPPLPDPIPDVPEDDEDEVPTETEALEAQVEDLTAKLAAAKGDLIRIGAEATAAGQP